MKQLLSDNERQILDVLVSEAEKQTGSQIVLAIVRKSDNYPEIPWKAFASGASAAGLVVFLADLLAGQWLAGTVFILPAAFILAAGMISAVITLMVPPAARLFLHRHRRETETMQYAQSLFLGHGVFSTGGRRGMLLFISWFERQIVILPDKGVRDQLTPGAMEGIIAEMKAALNGNDPLQAFRAGLDGIIRTIKAGAQQGGNDLPDKIIMEEGV